MANNWSDADRISDKIIDMVNAELKSEIGPLQIYAGQLLALMGFIRTAPSVFRPASFDAVEKVISDCLHDMTTAHRDEIQGQGIAVYPQEDSQ